MMMLLLLLLLGGAISSFLLFFCCKLSPPPLPPSSSSSYFSREGSWFLRTSVLGKMSTTLCFIFKWRGMEKDANMEQAIVSRQVKGYRFSVASNWCWGAFMITPSTVCLRSSDWSRVLLMTSLRPFPGQARDWRRGHQRRRGWRRRRCWRGGWRRRNGSWRGRQAA